MSVSLSTAVAAPSFVSYVTNRYRDLAFSNNILVRDLFSTLTAMLRVVVVVVALDGMLHYASISSTNKKSYP